ncbi:MAG: N-acetyl-gamma-glutamyl-phosphate reductase [Pseudomonadota bacterium]
METRVAIIGASGYTGAELIRLALSHPHIKITNLSAHTQAERAIEQLYPHFTQHHLPHLQTIDSIDWHDVDVAFFCLPHGYSNHYVKKIPPHVRIIDLSADFRLKDSQIYQHWYGKEHQAPELLQRAAYGLSELNVGSIKSARIIACPGCYPTATLLALLPLVKAGMISANDIIIDAKSGVSGAGRTLNQNNLFCEISEGLHPYNISMHRHMPEIEQELSNAAKSNIKISFTPHLVPMNRGELITAYIKRNKSYKNEDLRTCLKRIYHNKPFIQVMEPNVPVATRFVRASNHCHICVFDDRLNERSIIIAAIDNLVKGSSGQALQNFNIMMGYPEDTGLQQIAMFP